MKIKVIFNALDGTSEMRFVDSSEKDSEYITWNNFTQKSKKVGVIKDAIIHEEIQMESEE